MLGGSNIDITSAMLVEMVGSISVRRLHGDVGLDVGSRLDGVDHFVVLLA